MSQPVLFTLKINVFSLNLAITLSLASAPLPFHLSYLEAVPLGIHFKSTINSFKSHLKTFYLLQYSAEYR